jgi:mono/diheme cytochrome c family protein
MSKNNNQGSDHESWNRVDPAAASDGDIQRTHDELVHDKESPSHGFSPVPIFLVMLISALVVFCAIYMVWRSDDFDMLGYDETRRRFEWFAADGAAALAPGPQIGQRLFNQNCVACHQQTGQGLPGVFPPLDNTRWVTGSEERLIRLVLHGMVGPIEVRGNQYNGVMPAFGQQMNDEQMAGVLTFIRQAWTNEASAISADEVARVRAQTGARGPWEARELLQQFPLEEQ